MEHIVKDFNIGETRIRISDQCCRDVTEEEIEEILANIVARSISYFQMKTA